MLDNHRVLNDLCHEMDPTRFTTLACYAMCGPFNKVAHITDNILVTYCNGVDAMLWYVTAQLPEYENDPVVVSAMREAAYHNLYALVNSSGMNGMGEDTIVVPTKPLVNQILDTASIVLPVLMVLCAVLWILGAKKFRRTEEYIAWKAFRKQK